MTEARVRPRTISFRRAKFRRTVRGCRLNKTARMLMDVKLEVSGLPKDEA